MNNKKIDKNWWRPGVLIFAKVSASIAIPIIIALYLGKYLDNKYKTDPWIFLGLTFISFIVSLISIWFNIKSYIKDSEKSK